VIEYETAAIDAVDIEERLTVQHVVR